jgi:hypothetical protein
MRLRRTSSSFAPFASRSEVLFAPRLANVGHPTSDEIGGADLRQFLLEQRVAELESELADVKRRIEGQNQEPLDRGARLVSVVGQIRELSERIFPGPVSIEYACDPEDRSHEYIVFDVTAKGEYADYRDRYFEWHDEVDKIVPNRGGEFRLIVHPKP